jgi:hypothetical protein
MNNNREITAVRKIIFNFGLDFLARFQKEKAQSHGDESKDKHSW